MPTNLLDQLLKNPPPPPGWAEEERKHPIAIGAACTVLFHLLLWQVLPLLPLGPAAGAGLKKASDESTKGKTFDFLLERLPVAEEKLDPQRFVETNPEAPTNEPDKTENYSNRNQQTAQEVAATLIDPKRRPTVKGKEEDEPNQAIVSGESASPQDAAAAPLPEMTQEQQAQQARQEQIPLPGFEKKEGDAAEGIGTNVANTETPTTLAEKYLSGAKDGKGADGGLVMATEASKPQPKPRPKLARARPNILTNQIAGTNNIGVIGQDARWSEFGDYMQELIEIVQAQWNSLLEQSSVYPKGSQVRVTFKINAEGEISVLNVSETAGKHGTYTCLNAIQERQPYRKWTEPMIKLMGTEQTLTFEFIYR